MTTSSHAGRIWLTLRDNVAHGVNHRWAYATALALVTDDFSPQEIGRTPARQRRDHLASWKFIRDLAPRFQKSLMDNPRGDGCKLDLMSPELTEKLERLREYLARMEPGAWSPIPAAWTAAWS